MDAPTQEDMMKSAPQPSGSAEGAQGVDTNNPIAAINELAQVMEEFAQASQELAQALRGLEPVVRKYLGVLKWRVERRAERCHDALAQGDLEGAETWRQRWLKAYQEWRTLTDPEYAEWRDAVTGQTGLPRMATDAARDYLNQLNELSRVTGMAIEDAQTMLELADDTGLNAAELTQGMARLAQMIEKQGG